jgi:cytochrome c oxidase subunit 3
MSASQDVLAVSSAMASPEPRDTGIPGNKAIWVGIFAEMTEFALMFFVYFIARAHHPEAFHQGPAKLVDPGGHRQHPGHADQ